MGSLHVSAAYLPVLAGRYMCSVTPDENKATFIIKHDLVSGKEEPINTAKF